MSRRATYRGQPVLLLLALVAGWCGMRIALWRAPFPDMPAERAVSAAARVVAPLVTRAPQAVEPEPPAMPARVLPPPAELREPMWLKQVEPSPPRPLTAEPLPAEPPMPSGWTFAAEPAREPSLTPRLAGGHTLLLAAAFSAFEMPPQLVALLLHGRAAPATIPSFPRVATPAAPLPRWSGDSWLLLRQDTTTPVTSGRGSYGRSQAGTVLRYRLAPSSGHRPAAYLRASAALSGARELELAAGLSARPLPRIPLVVAAEGRVFRLGNDVETRPAAFAYSEFPPLALPLGLRGEAYVQAGYVGGRRGTGFVDGQVRLDREVARLGPAELRAGAGAWGGAQKGAKRLDVGPGATVTVELGGAPVRMSADWRFRIAGEANPASGPALTVSTGF